MSQIEPTEEQRAAIYTPGNLLVRAGAGSGKTEVLARRFVALLAGDIEGREPLSPEQIVAITFTEKAAHDMKQRIAKVLGERLDKAAADGQPAALAAHLARARRLLPLARISTIHAFCARLLREHPLEAGVDPDFEVLDDYQSLTFLEAGCDEFLIAALRRGDPGARHLVEACGLRSASEYRPGALDLLLKLIEEMERLGRTPQWLAEATGRACAGIRAERTQVRSCAQELIGKIEKLMAMQVAAPKAASQVSELKRRRADFLPVLERFSADSPEADLEALRALGKTMPAAQARDLREPLKEIRALLHTDNSRCGLSGRLIELYGAQRAVAPTLEVCATVAEAAAIIAERKRRDGVVTFNDLLVLTHRLLVERPAVAARYRRMFRAILVDEYQDTDPIQDAVVSALSTPAGGEAVPELFIVGDEKQSIYRFRGADVTVFNRERSPAPRPLPLRQNRRATPNLLRFVNGLSERVMRAGASPAAPFWIEWRDDHRLEPHRGPVAEPSVELHLSACAGEMGAAQGREREATSLANRCRELAAGSTLIAGPRSGVIRVARWADIAILMRSFTDVESFERALRAAEVPYYTVKGRGFFRCAEILDITSLLAAVNDPQDGVALAAALRSPFFALSDQCLMEIAVGEDGEGHGLLEGFARGAPGFDRLRAGRDDAAQASRVLIELRQMKEQCGLAELIERALELTDFEAVMLAQPDGRQRAANIRKLLEITREFEARRFFGFADFIRHLGRLTETEPLEPQAQILGEDENVVRLMTIHQAKGLEFPIVMLADLGRGLMRPDLDYLLSAEHGLLMRATIGSGQDELPNPLLTRHRELLKEQERAERARLLYVAVTRARDRLILSEGARAGEWAAQVREFVGEKKIAAFIASGKTQAAVAAGQAQVLLRQPATARAEPAASGSAEPSQGPERERAEMLAQRRLSFTPPPVRELLVSPTQLADFNRCPRQYCYRQVLRIPEGGFFRDADGAAEAGALELGLVAHAALEGIDLGPDREAMAAELERVLDSCAAGIALDPQDRAALGRDLLRYLEARDHSERIVGRELPFFMHLEDGELLLFVRGQIDVLLEDRGGWVVRDYKYARPSAQDITDYRVQMECYALAASSGYGPRQVRAELVFLREQPQTVEVPLSESQGTRASLLALGRAMLEAERGQEYPKKPSGADECRHLGCGYIGRCWRR